MISGTIVRVLNSWETPPSGLDRMVVEDLATGLESGLLDFVKTDTAFTSLSALEISLAISTNGQKVAICALDVAAATVSVFDVASQTKVSFSLPADTEANSLVFTHDGAWVAVNAYEYSETGNVLLIHDSSTGAAVSGAPTLTQWVYGPEFSHDGSLMAIGDASGALVVYNTSTWATVTLGSALPAADWVRTLRFSPDGSRLVVGVRNMDNEALTGIRVYETTGWTYSVPSVQPTQHTNGLWMCFSPSGDHFAAVGGDLYPEVNIYSTADWSAITVTHETAVAAPPNKRFTKAYAFSSDSSEFQYLVFASGAPNNACTVHRLNASTGAYIGSVDVLDIPGTSDEAMSPYVLGSSPETTFVVTTGSTGEVRGANGLPISGVVVRIYNRDTGVMLDETVTDVDGKFASAAMSAGPTAIQVVLLDDSTPARNDLIYRIAL